MQQCCWYNASACCINQYTAQLDTFYLTYVKYILGVFGGRISDTCYLTFANAVCYMCAPNSASFMRWTDTVPEFRVCSSFCSELYSACQNDISVLFNSTSVRFGSSEEFCVAFYTASLGIGKASVTTTDCFQGIPSQVIKQFQNVCIPPNSSSFLQPNFVLVVILVLFVCLMAFKAYE
jgi:hypothetical protein